MSLFMPGVLTEGGALGREDERTCRCRGVAPSLLMALAGLSEWMISSIRDVMLTIKFDAQFSYDSLLVYWTPKV
jgi:hypothetical protein